MSEWEFYCICQHLFIWKRVTHNLKNYMFYGKISSNSSPPQPFDGPLTIVDTSPVWPFVNRDRFNSRYNLMNALAIRNLCRFFESCNYLAGTKENGEQDYRVGVCTPYAAQSKVLKRILNGHSLKNKIDTGAVHRYQGDEKHVMIMDIPDSHGEYRASIFLDSDHPPLLAETKAVCGK